MAGSITQGGAFVLLAMGGVRDARDGAQRTIDCIRIDGARQARGVGELFWKDRRGLHDKAILESFLASDGDGSVL